MRMSGVDERQQLTAGQPRPTVAGGRNRPSFPPGPRGSRGRRPRGRCRLSTRCRPRFTWTRSGPCRYWPRASSTEYEATGQALALVEGGITRDRRGDDSTAIMRLGRPGLSAGRSVHQSCAPVAPDSNPVRSRDCLVTTAGWARRKAWPFRSQLRSCALQSSWASTAAPY